MNDAIRLLLIEDNPGDVRLIKEMLRGPDGQWFDLESAETFAHGLARAREAAFDVLLLDLSLPDSSGIETLTRACAELPETAIVVLTGYDDQTVGVQAVQQGAQDYLVKGDVDGKLLRRTINYAMERHRAEMALLRSSEEYRSLIDDVFDTSMVAVIILDREFSVVWCNEATEVYFGVAREQLLGEDKRKLIDDRLKCIFADPDDYATRLLDAYTRQSFSDRFECHVLPGPNREERWLEHWSQPIRSGMYAGGRIEQYTDITARKRLQEAELEQRRYAEALRATAAVLTSTLDLDEVLDRILSNIETVVQHDTASIALRDGDSSTVTQRYSQAGRANRTINASKQAELEDLLLNSRPAGQDGAWVIPDLRADPRFAALAAQAGVRSYADVPIRVRAQTSGFIRVFDRRAMAFDEDDLIHLTAFAEHSAIAIENARLYRQSQDLAALEERQRLARDLHDLVSQTLFTSTALAESALRRWEKDPARAHELVTEVHDLVTTALSEMRILLLELRPDSLTKVNLRQLFEQYLVPIQRRSGFELDLQIDAPPLPKDVQIALYRIAQETLNNISKHASAQQVWVIVQNYPDRLDLTIRDDGVGFDPEQTDMTGLGLGILRERAESIGATLQITSRPGQGTQMMLSWPKAHSKGT